MLKSLFVCRNKKARLARKNLRTGVESSNFVEKLSVGIYHSFWVSEKNYLTRTVVSKIICSSITRNKKDLENCLPSTSIQYLNERYKYKGSRGNISFNKFLVQYVFFLVHHCGCPLSRARVANKNFPRVSREFYFRECYHTIFYIFTQRQN